MKSRRLFIVFLISSPPPPSNVQVILTLFKVKYEAGGLILCFEMGDRQVRSTLVERTGTLRRKFSLNEGSPTLHCVLKCDTEGPVPK